jgi:hypothetical protein
MTSVALETLDARARMRLVRILQKRHPAQSLAISLFTAGVTLANIFAALAALRVWYDALFDRGLNPSSTLYLMLTVAGFMLVSAPGPIAALLARDFWRRRLLAGFASAGACVWCGYSLVALEPEDGVLCCPECGTKLQDAHSVWVPICVVRGAGTLTRDPGRGSGV